MIAIRTLYVILWFALFFAAGWLWETGHAVFAVLIGLLLWLTIKIGGY